MKRISLYVEYASRLVIYIIHNDLLSCLRRLKTFLEKGFKNSKNFQTDYIDLSVEGGNKPWKSVIIICDCSTINTFSHPLEPGLFGTVDDVVLERAGESSKECAVACDADYESFILFGVFLCVKKGFL